MSTKMSNDMIMSRSSTRLHAPPGGASTISFGDPSSTTPAPMASTTVISSPVKARNLDDQVPISMGLVDEAIEEKVQTKPEPLSQVVVIIASPLTDVQSALSTAIVRSLVAEGLSANDVNITYINEPLSLPYAVQKIATSCNVIIASAVLSGVDANTTSQMISGSLYQQGLNGNIHIVPAIVARESLLETKAMLPLASSNWAKAAVALLNVDVDLSVTPAQEPEKRDVDITNELAKQFSTETSDTEILMANLRVTVAQHGARGIHGLDRKSTRLNSSH